MNFQRFLSTTCLLCILMSLGLTACQGQPAPASPTQPVAPQPAATGASAPLLYRDPSAAIEQRVADLLGRMTLAEKVGQMAQVQKNAIQKGDIAAKGIGSLLSGGGGSPQPNTPEKWLQMVNGFQAEALKSRLGIPLIYGVDAVHGHGNLKGATVFPQQIGLGAAGDPDLVQRIGRATAEEVAATGIHWNFAPVVAMSQDIRWGRTYESYGENTASVSMLGAAYVRGLQQGSPTVLATPKHFLADGGTTWGTSTTVNMGVQYMLDQGDAQIDEAALRAIHLPPYQAAIDAGADSVMVSFSSLNGTKMHASKQWVTDVLKGELGFGGIAVSDWGGIDQIPGDYISDVVTAINAGLDMIMVPDNYGEFIAALTQAAERGDVPMARIDDAVRRILTVKFKLGLFDNTLPGPENLSQVGSEAHRALAREAVRRSLVLLKNAANALPLQKDAPLIFVAGEAADDIGVQCGGWTIEWQGATGAITPGTTILAGIEQAVAAGTKVQYDRYAGFDRVKDASGSPAVADVGIAVVGERPYAEGVGDSAALALSPADLAVVEKLRERSKTLVVVLLSGRPLIVNVPLAQADALVAAWLPGTEGAGVADGLFGDYPFTGKLPYTWPRSVQQLPFSQGKPSGGEAEPLFPYGFGIQTK